MLYGTEKDRSRSHLNNTDGSLNLSLFLCKVPASLPLLVVFIICLCVQVFKDHCAKQDTQQVSERRGLDGGQYLKAWPLNDKRSKQSEI